MPAEDIEPENATQALVVPTRGSGRFEPGKTTNAGGRPITVRVVQNMARKQTKAAIRILTEAMGATMVNVRGEDVPDHRIRIMAAEALLSRGYGRAPLTPDEGDRQVLRVGVVILPAEEITPHTAKEVLEARLEEANNAEDDGPTYE